MALWWAVLLGTFNLIVLIIVFGTLVGSSNVRAEAGQEDICAVALDSLPTIRAADSGESAS